MKKILLVLLGGLFLVGCGYEQGADYQQYELDLEVGSDVQVVVESVFVENRHPFAVVLYEMMNDVTYYITEFVAGRYAEVDAFLVDIDGNGTIGMLVRTWERSGYGAIIRQGTLFYLYNDELRFRAMGEQTSVFSNATIAESNRLVRVLRGGTHTGYSTYVIIDGTVVENMIIYRDLIDVIVDEDSGESISIFGYFLNNEPSTEEVFLGIKSKYNLYNFRFRTNEEVLVETKNILVMTADGINLMDNDQEKDEIILAENAHPFAVKLLEILRAADADDHVPLAVWQRDFPSIIANLVDADGNNTKAMLVVIPQAPWPYDEDIRAPRGWLFYLYNEELVYKYVGHQNSGFVTGITANGNRVVNLMGDGGHWSYSIFEMENGRLVRRMVLFGDAWTYLGDGEWKEYPVVYDGSLNPITEEERREILERYGLEEILPHWWEMNPDDTQLILSLIAD